MTGRVKFPTHSQTGTRTKWVHTLYFVKNLNIYLPMYLTIAVLKFTECEKALFVSYGRRGLHTITPTLPTPDFVREG